MNMLKVYISNGESPKDPLLFLICINDLTNFISITPRLFAEDTCLVYGANNTDKLVESINLDLTNISKWMKANKLRINPQKSTTIIISPKSNKPVCTQGLTIFYDGPVIENSKSVKYLGVFDDDLLFKTRIQLLHNKFSHSLGMLFRVKSFLSKNCFLQLYHALFHSHLTYCISIWALTYKSYLNPIQHLQNRAVKLVAGFTRQHSSSEAYKELKVLKFDDLYSSLKWGYLPLPFEQ